MVHNDADCRRIQLPVVSFARDIGCLLKVSAHCRLQARGRGLTGNDTQWAFPNLCGTLVLDGRKSETDRNSFQGGNELDSVYK